MGSARTRHPSVASILLMKLSVPSGRPVRVWRRNPSQDSAACLARMRFQMQLQLFALAYNLGNFLRRLALPQSVKHWSLTTLRKKLVKIGAKVVTRSRYVTFQMAEVAIPRRLFETVLRRIQ